jgi:hypothetical protein
MAKLLLMLLAIIQLVFEDKVDIHNYLIRVLFEPTVNKYNLLVFQSNKFIIKFTVKCVNPDKIAGVAITAKYEDARP